jgi:hypothetical protein
MSTAHHDQPISVAAYLRGEASAQRKHEYVDGVVYAMVGATNVHNRIATNATGVLHGQLRGQAVGFGGTPRNRLECGLRHVALCTAGARNRVHAPRHNSSSPARYLGCCLPGLLNPVGSPRLSAGGVGCWRTHRASRGTRPVGLV